MLKIFQKLRPGYTILEVLVSIAIVVIGIFAVLTLAVSGLTTTSKALEYVIASNLAREGIELVRNRRDSNWYTGANFDAGLKDPISYTAVIDYNDAEFTFVPDDLDAPAAELKRQGGVYTRDVGSPTDYRRLLYLNNICQDLSAEPIIPSNESVKTAGAPCPPPETKIGIDVISSVKWTSKAGEFKIVELNDRLYDWR